MTPRHHPERSKNRYARFWRADYLRMADCELRQDVSLLKNLSDPGVRLSATIEPAGRDRGRWIAVAQAARRS
jgi:hypothetical protein